MQEVINEALIPMINEGLISVPRIHELIYIKEFVDRVSSRRFVDSESEKKLRSRFGVSPSVITWGDYFQTELATALLHVSEEEFTRSVDAVRYDIISSCQIFTGKGRDFIDWVERAHLEVTTGGLVEGDAVQLFDALQNNIGGILDGVNGFGQRVVASRGGRGLGRWFGGKINGAASAKMDVEKIG